MTLNLDCLRDIMLYVEDNQVYTPQNTCGDADAVLVAIVLPSLRSTDERLFKYGEYDVQYCCKQAIDSGLLDGYPYLTSKYWIDDITPKGHEFIAALRNDSVWDKVKDKSKELGKMSLPVLIKTGADILAARFLG